MTYFSHPKIGYLLLGLIVILTGCCNCDNTYYSFRYTDFSITNIDNSGQWSKPTNLNTMDSSTVAFEINIIGSDPVLIEDANSSYSGTGNSLGQSCNCEDLYQASDSIQKITITTIYDLNEEYCCGADVSDLFLANNCFECEDIGSFYVNLEELIDRINPQAFYHVPSNNFLIYLKIPVENTIAQFEVEVLLSNGESLTATTAQLDIK